MTPILPAARLRMADFDYELPPELIAQEPLSDRATSRMLHLERASERITHGTFKDLPSLLREGDLLVVNDSRVLPARLHGRRQSGAQVEVLLLREEHPGIWRALARPARKLRVDEPIVIDPRSDSTGLQPAHATLRSKEDNGHVLIELDTALQSNPAQYGHVPLPPYITRQLDDDERYQTVYAQHTGSAAAPTAGLHFTDAILDDVRQRGVRFATVTLHVGLDTFRPITSEYAEDHTIHQEWCTVPEATWQAIAATKSAGGRVVAVGTTAARTLETLGQRLQASEEGGFTSSTGIYITPGYSWQMVDALITNFHLPKSTLLLMISSFAGKELVFRAYREAIAERYRFFSFGDAMFIE